MRKTYTAVLASTVAAVAVAAIAATTVPAQAAMTPSAQQAATTFKIEAQGYFGGNGTGIFPCPILGGTVTDGQGQLAIKVPATSHGQPSEVIAFHVSDASVTSGHFTATLTNPGTPPWVLKTSLNGQNWSFSGTDTFSTNQTLPITHLTVQS